MKIYYWSNRLSIVIVSVLSLFAIIYVKGAACVSHLRLVLSRCHDVARLVTRRCYVAIRRPACSSSSRHRSAEITLISRDSETLDIWAGPGSRGPPVVASSGQCWHRVTRHQHCHSDSDPGTATYIEPREGPQWMTVLVLILE